MYFDPGLGSMIIQIVVAGIAAAGIAVGVMKARVKGWFCKRKNPDKQSGEVEDIDDQL